jgi:secreted PhoX family phosphatase
MTPRVPSMLPLISSGGPHGSRSALTCRLRCADACFHPMPNRSGNQDFATVAARALARRSVLKGAAAASSTLALSGLFAESAAAAGSTPSFGAGTLDFTPVPPNTRDNVTVPKGHDYDVVVRWGDRLLADAPAFDVYNQTPESQAGQFGYNCDYVGVLAHPDYRGRRVMVANNEYTDDLLMFPDGDYSENQQKRIEMQAHGMSVLEIERGNRSGSWKRVSPKRATLNRRITATTPIRLTGPAAGDPRLRTSQDPTGRLVRGTFANCSGGETPWKTVLSGEENFNGYFDVSGALDDRYTESYERYGVTGEDSRGWSSVDPRFDLTAEPREVFRFGWIVELDPYDPTSLPRKRTMLGRAKHEGANISIASDGRAVAYMGDDERGEYIYKFVSKRRYRAGGGQAAHAHNMSLLDEGTLYVARFEGDGFGDDVYDGTGRWLRLTSDTESYVAGMSVADVLINTRLAADTVNPTRMDRPEDIEPNPVNGRIYCALTNNYLRGTEFDRDEANPLTESMIRETLDGPLVTSEGNRNGYILEIAERDGDHTATRFGWNLFLVCGEPDAPETYFAGFDKDLVSPISCPDNVTFDRAGNLWISTDGNVLGSHDGVFAVPVQGPERGRVQQFLTMPTGAEASGPLVTRDGKTVFAAVQHPGETDEATFEQPSSTWPHTDRFPRPSVICAFRVNG